MKSFEQLFEEIADRKINGSSTSATKKELEAGVHFIGKKIVEEAAEVWMACEHESKEAATLEISQLIYHLQVMMVHKNISLEDLYSQL